MATIYKEFNVNAAPELVWEAIKDVGAVHTRLAPGLVTNTTLADGVRTVTFANGFVVKERIVAVSDAQRRVAYAAMDDGSAHHNASFQVFAAPQGQSRVLWITDVLPDGMLGPVGQIVDMASEVIAKTLEGAAAASK